MVCHRVLPLGHYFFCCISMIFLWLVNLTLSWLLMTLSWPCQTTTFLNYKAVWIRDGTGQDFFDPTRPVNFKIIAGWPASRPAGQPVSDRPGRPVFLVKVFLHYSMYLKKNFWKGGHGWGVKICDFRWGLRKTTQKNFCVCCKNDSILRPFLVKVWFERPVLSSEKRAQNKHKKHWRAQAKLLDFLLIIFCERPKNEVTIF